MGTATEQSRTGADQRRGRGDTTQGLGAMDVQGGQPHPVEPSYEPITDDADATEPKPCPCGPDRWRQIEEHQGDQHTYQRGTVAFLGLKK